MKSKKNLIIVLVILCVLIASIPLLVIKDSEFGGADGAAEDVISEVDPNYEAWASPILELQVEKQKVFYSAFKLLLELEF